eukprot:scaffold26280_cov151-Skeletonema_menzelii.AAC.3
MRRRQLDHSVLERVIQLDIDDPKGEDRQVIVGGTVHKVEGLDESADNHNWISLMEDGEDIIDHLKYIIRRLNQEHNFYGIEQSQLSETKYKKGRIERICESISDTFDIMHTCERVLNGIHRLHSYQQWKFLNDKKTDTYVLETGALVVAKFYLSLGICRFDDNGKSITPVRISNVDDEIDSRLCELANTIKTGLEQRLGHCENFPLMEVIQEMQSIFGNDSPHKFKGNTTNYYDANNSLLHEVLTRKTGIPITLAIVYTAIVRRVCGAQLDLIGLPGHIVIGLPFDDDTPPRERLFVDVFNGGTHLSQSDLKSIVSQYGLTWSDEMANPISHQQVWERMVRNLMHCHSDLSIPHHGQNDNVRVLMTLQCLIDPRTRVEPRALYSLDETFKKMILAPGFSAYTC